MNINEETVMIVGRVAAVSLVVGALVSACATTPPALRSAVAAAQQTTMIVGVNVVSVTDGTIERDRTLVIRDGRIVRVAPRRDVAPIGGARVVEGRGRYVMPGLTDMHAHLPSPDDTLSLDDTLFLFLSKGVTTVRAMRGDEAQLRRRDAIARGEAEGPTLLVSAPYFTDDEQFTASKAAALAATYKGQGFDFIKLLGGFPDEIYEGVIAAATRNGLPVMGHVPKNVGLERAIDAGQADVEHIDPLVQLHRDHPGDVTRVIAKMARLGVATCPDIYWYVVMSSGRELSELQHSTRGLDYVPPSVTKGWSEEIAKKWRDDAPKELARKEKIGHDIDSYLVLLRQMQQAGVAVLTSASEGNFIVPGFGLMEELRLFERAGLSRAEVLRAATSDAARAHHQENEWGTIAEGRRADLLLLAANPLDDLANLDGVEGVMTRGRWISKEEIAARLSAMKSRNAVR